MSYRIEEEEVMIRSGGAFLNGKGIPPELQMVFTNPPAPDSKTEAKISYPVIHWDETPPPEHLNWGGWAAVKFGDARLDMTWLGNSATLRINGKYVGVWRFNEELIDASEETCLKLGG